MGDTSLEKGSDFRRKEGRWRWKLRQAGVRIWVPLLITSDFLGKGLSFCIRKMGERDSTPQWGYREDHARLMPSTWHGAWRAVGPWKRFPPFPKCCQSLGHWWPHTG